MSGNDLFSDESFGTFSSYSQRNQEAVRAERAADADKRIAEFAARKKTLEWANEAIDFCRRESEAGKDIADISTGIQDLPRILAEAEAIIEKDRQQKESDRLAAEERVRLARERDAQAVIDRINELDSLISDLASAPESSYWCDEVGRVKNEVEKAPQNVRLKLKNLPQLDKMLDRVRVLREAYAISTKIASLKKMKSHGEGWAKDILDLNLLVSFENAKDITDLDYLEKSYDEANKILRSKTVEGYRRCLDAVEGGNAEGQIDTYKTLSAALGSLGYSPELYISDFDKRWRKAASLVEAAEKRLIDAAAERERIRLAEERAAEEKRRRAAAEKRKKQQRAQMIEMLLRLAAPIVAAIVTAVLAVVLGLVLGDMAPLGVTAVLVIGYAAVMNVLKGCLPLPVTTINTVASAVLGVVGVILLFIPGLNVIGTAMFVAVILSTVGIIIQDRSADVEYMMCAYVLVIALALTFLSLGFMLNSVFEDYDPMCYCIGLGALLCPILAIILRKLSNYDDGKQFTGLGITTIVIAGVAFLGGLLYGIGVGVNDLAGFLGLGLSIFGGCLSPILMDVL